MIGSLALPKKTAGWVLTHIQIAIADQWCGALLYNSLPVALIPNANKKLFCYQALSHYVCMCSSTEFLQLRIKKPSDILTVSSCNMAENQFSWTVICSETLLHYTNKSTSMCPCLTRAGQHFLNPYHNIKWILQWFRVGLHEILELAMDRFFKKKIKVDAAEAKKRWMLHVPQCLSTVSLSFLLRQPWWHHYDIIRVIFSDSTKALFSLQELSQGTNNCYLHLPGSTFLIVLSPCQLSVHGE